MHDQGSHAPQVHVSVLDAESPYLIRLQTRLRCGDWGGVVSAYANPRVLCQDAELLASWSRSPVAEWTIGWEGMGSTRFRFRIVDGAGHIRCQVELRSESPAPEGVDRPPSQLSFEIPTEPGLIDRFAQRLRSIAASGAGDATLEGTI